MKRSTALLSVLGLLVAATLIGCGAGVEDGDDAIAGEDEIRSPKTLKCKFENPPAIYEDSLDEGYVLSLSGTKATGAFGPNDESPDRFAFKRRDGDKRFYVASEKLDVPPTISQGKWSIVMGLSVPPAVAEGRAGKITISYWVKKGDSLTPYVGSEQQRSLEDRQRSIDRIEQTLLEGVRDLAKTTLTGSCKP